MSKPVIEINNLSKSYMIGHEGKAAPGTVTLRDTITGIIKKPVELITGHKLKKEKFWALKDVNLKINQGEVVGIIGRNGSGKSTMLKVLSRIVEPTKGEIIMRGKAASLLEVGTGFHPELTGRENIYFNGSILGMKKKEIDAKFDEIVAFSEVEKFLDTPVKFYSSGMYVRLAFSVAAHLEPDILIVDEVLAVGDAAFQTKCLGKMKDVASQGRTVIFVSHNMGAVKSLCNKAVWLDRGKLVSTGDISNVIDSYSEGNNYTKTDISKKPRTTAVSGEAKIVGLDIFNGKKSGSKKELYSAEKINFKFIIKSKADIREGIHIHFRIMSAGIPVITIQSEYQGNSFRIRKGINSLTCSLDATKLAGGLYSVDCSIVNSGKAMSGHIDEIYDAASFRVSDYKVPSSNYYINQKDAVYYVESRWNIDD